eukprot:m.1058599 g.1058599  ORF g.1058599 m.1058599 type:complete len:478 (+) comp24208_c0_seq3:180-1613(+)
MSIFLVSILSAIVAKFTILPGTHPLLPPLPHYGDGVHINMTLPHAGLPLVHNVSYKCVYSATDPSTGGRNSMGTYNHGAIIAHVNDTFILSWYNGPVSESQQNRVLFSTSRDATTWTPPQIAFPVISTDGTSGHGEQAEPYIFVNNRVYIAASSAGTPAWNNTHDSGIRGAKVARRLILRKEGVSLGPIFWLSTQPPPVFREYGFPGYVDMDKQTQLDALTILQRQINTTVSYSGSDDGGFNERSLYALPRNGTQSPIHLALWLRKQGKAAEAMNTWNESSISSASEDIRTIWASTCVLPADGDDIARARTAQSSRTHANTGTCVAGTGAYEYKLLPAGATLVHRERAVNPTIGWKQGSPGPIQCNWTVPQPTNIPDAPSRTCAGPLPDGNGVWTLGNQGGHGRDPLVVSTSADGITFDRAAVVAWDAPPVRYPGNAKCPGFQYPSGIWVRSPNNRVVMYAAYSISKEDIVVASFTL